MTEETHRQKTEQTGPSDQCHQRVSIISDIFRKLFQPRAWPSNVSDALS